jgi:hypothetical protein
MITNERMNDEDSTTVQRYSNSGTVIFNFSIIVNNIYYICIVLFV